MEQKNSYEKIYDIVKQIPRGTVATYGQVAALAGNKRWARVVGYAPVSYTHLDVYKRQVVVSVIL